jgi:hypothetical protein
VEQCLDRIADTDVPSIVTAYERRIRDLEQREDPSHRADRKLRPRAAGLRRRT